MRVLWRRPLLCACIFAVLFVLAGRLLFGTSLFFLVLFAIAALTLAFFLKKHFQKIFPLFLCCVLSCLLLLSSFIYDDLISPSYQKLVGVECKISGYVTDRRSGSDSFLVTVTELDGNPARFVAVLDCDFSSGIQVGDHIEADVTGIPFSEAKSHNEEESLLSERVKVLFSCTDTEGLIRRAEEGFHPLLLFRKWNHVLSIRLQNAVGGEAGDLAAALLLGNKSGLSSDTKLAFRRAGLSHLLALSGLHVSVIVGALGFFLRKIFQRRWLRVTLLLGCLLFYLALTGFRASCLRATLMVFAVSLAFLLWEDPDPLTSLGAALYLTLLFAPYSIGLLSLWMSYLATFGILVFSPAISLLSTALERRLKRPGRVLGKILGLLLVGFAANSSLLLLMSLKFGEVALASIPATAVLSLPTALTLVTSLITLIFPSLGFLPKLFAGWMIDFANLVSDRPGVLPSTSSPLMIGLMVAITILFLVLALLKIKRPIVFLSLPLAVVLVLGTAVVLQGHRNAEYLSEDTKIEIEEGCVYVLCKNSTERKAADELNAALRMVGSSEIHHLTVWDYSALQPYFLARLTSSTRVFCLHLPQPKTKEELSISIRLEQEAELHRIYVIYED